MSGGKKITDRSFMGMSGSPEFPKGNKVQHFSSAEGAGHEAYFEDTTEAIKKSQEMGDRKVKGHKMKDNYRY